MKAITCFILLASTALAQSVFPPARSTTPAAIATAKRCISAGGSSTAYTCTLTPGISSYTTSMEVNWFADVTSGASPTLDAGGGPVAIRDAQASAAVPSGWFEANRWYTLRHNGTYWLSDGCVDGAAGRKCGSTLSESLLTIRRRAQPRALPRPAQLPRQGRQLVNLSFDL